LALRDTAIAGQTPVWWELVAQSVEHVTFNHGVMGSNPIELTKNILTNQRLIADGSTT
jgi:hypothetical protein